MAHRRQGTRCDEPYTAPGSDVANYLGFAWRDKAGRSHTWFGDQVAKIIVQMCHLPVSIFWTEDTNNLLTDC